MQLMPNALPISAVKTDPTGVLRLVNEGPVILTSRGKGVAVVSSLAEWNKMAQRLARFERLARLDEAIRRNDLVDYEYADAN